MKAPFSVVVDDPPVDELNEEYPFRLTTGRRLDSYNTGVQSGGYTSPMRRPETLDVSPEDAGRLGISDHEVVVVSAADPLNMIGILLPGARVSPFSGMAIAHRNGAPVDVAPLGALLSRMQKTDGLGAVPGLRV